MNDPLKSHILKQIASIPSMEPGTLSSYTFKGRPGAAGPYHKLQHWHHGKNHTRYVSAEELPAVQAAVDGFTRFNQLTQEYAGLVIEETRQQLAGSKKKKSLRKSSWPRTRKSSS